MVSGVTTAPSRPRARNEAGKRSCVVGALARGAEQENEENGETSHAFGRPRFHRPRRTGKVRRFAPVLVPTVSPSDPPPQSPVPAERLGWLALVGALALFFLIGVALQMVNAGAGIWFTEVFLFFGFGWALVRWSGRSPGRLPGVVLAWHVGRIVFALGIAVANYFAMVIPLQFLAQLVAPRAWVEMFDQTQVFERQARAGPLPGDDRRGRRRADRRGGHLPRAAPPGAPPSRRGNAAGGRWPRPPSSASATSTSSACRRCSSSGLVFGLMYVRTRSVLPGMVAHLGSNLTATLLYVVGKGQEPGPTEASAQLPAVLTASVAGWLLLGVVLPSARRVPEAWGTPREVDGVRPRDPVLPGPHALGGRCRGLPRRLGAGQPPGSRARPGRRASPAPSAARRRSRTGCASDGPRWTRCGTTCAGEARRSTATCVPVARSRARGARRRRERGPSESSPAPVTWPGRVTVLEHAVAAHLQDRADHRDAHPRIVHVAVDLHPLPFLEQRRAAAGDLVRPSVLSRRAPRRPSPRPGTRRFPGPSSTAPPSGASIGTSAPTAIPLSTSQGRARNVKGR